VLTLLKLLVQTQSLMLRLLVHSRPLFGGEDPVSGKPWHHAKITWHAAKAAGWSAPGDWKQDETDPTDERYATACDGAQVYASVTQDHQWHLCRDWSRLLSNMFRNLGSGSLYVTEGSSSPAISTYSSSSEGQEVAARKGKMLQTKTLQSPCGYLAPDDKRTQCS
jgi:hypothetical protein